MRVLVVSHNVFSKTTGMGKTLSAYFRDFKPCELAQLYIHSEIPVDSLCERYYRVTDSDMLRSILIRKSGTAFTKEDIQPLRPHSRTDRGLAAKLYRAAGKRTPIIYFLRNMLWKIGRWKTPAFQKWLDEFDPQAVFFASGDYAFLYCVAREIATERNLPLYVSCMDDFYFYDRNQNLLFGKCQHTRFMRQVSRTMQAAAAIFAICDRMARDYGAFFHKPVYVLHTGSDITEPFPAGGDRISYIGNLSLGRDHQLCALGRALQRVTGGERWLDVYSTETDPARLKQMTKENGIRFGGALDAAGVRRVMGESLLLVHTESFENPWRQLVSYSVSTKIADSLASGRCLFAYGPPEVASIAYLREYNAAFCVLDEKELDKGLARILREESLRQSTVAHALALAAQNHQIGRNSRLIRQVLEETIK